jgi:hypothetical protein
MNGKLTVTRFRLGRPPLYWQPCGSPLWPRTDEPAIIPEVVPLRLRWETNESLYPGIPIRPLKDQATCDPSMDRLLYTERKSRIGGPNRVIWIAPESDDAESSLEGNSPPHKV